MSLKLPLSQTKKAKKRKKKKIFAEIGREALSFVNHIALANTATIVVSFVAFVVASTSFVLVAAEFSFAYFLHVLNAFV